MNARRYCFKCRRRADKSQRRLFRSIMLGAVIRRFRELTQQRQCGFDGSLKFDSKSNHSIISLQAKRKTSLDAPRRLQIAMFTARLLSIRKRFAAHKLNAINRRSSARSFRLRFRASFATYRCTCWNVTDISSRTRRWERLR